MAVRYAVATGNWSAVGTWDGGASLPTTGDTVHADGWTVTIDQSINVGSLRSTQRAGGTVGGGFVVSTGGYTLTLTDATTGLWVGATGSANVLTVSHNTGTTYIIGKVVGNVAQPASGYCISLTGTGTIDITGNVDWTGGNSSAGTITSSALGTINITGNVSHTTGSVGGWNVYTIRATTINAITIVGAVTRGSSASGVDGGTIYTASSATITITGNVQTASSDSSGTIKTTNNGSLTINGDITGASGPAINISGAITLTVNGTSNGKAIVSTGASTIIVTGNVTADSGNSSITSSSTSSIVRVSGNLIDHPSTGQQAIYAVRVTGNWSASRYHRFMKYTGGTVDLVTTDSLTGLPSVGNVRNGTTFGVGLSQTGTLKVPNPSDVRVSVGTDNTVGTAQMTPSDFWAYLVSNATVAGSMGLRLKNAATVDSTGAQMAALGA